MVFHLNSLKTIWICFVKFFSILFNSFIQHSYVSDVWRDAIVTPLLQKDLDARNVESYRPISVTNNVCRIFEKILCKRLCEFLETNDLLASNHYGFRKGKSTLSNLIDTYDYVTSQLELKNSVDVIYLDFEKAFDKVDKLLLINKQININVPNYIVLWVENF